MIYVCFGKVVLSLVGGELTVAFHSIITLVADMATEHSKLCCERLAEGGAVNKLLQLIQTVNRSPPHEQVLKHALSILGNLARFPNLAFSVASEHDSVNIIVEQLLIFRQKA